MPVRPHRVSVAILTASPVTAGFSVATSHVQMTGQSAHGPVVAPMPFGVACGVGLMTGMTLLLRRRDSRRLRPEVRQCDLERVRGVREHPARRRALVGEGDRYEAGADVAGGHGELLAALHVAEAGGRIHRR